MSLAALASYGDSDESDNEDSDIVNEDVPPTVPTSLPAAPPEVSSETTKSETNDIGGHISDEEGEQTYSEKESGTIHLPESKVTLLNTDFDIRCLTSANKRNGPVKITIPSLNQVDEDAEPPSKKKLKPSQKGSGLFALLPSPKSSLVPQSVTNRANKTAAPKRPPSSKPPANPSALASKKATSHTPTDRLSSINYEDSGDEDDASGTVDFFSFNSKEPDVVPAPVDITIPELDDTVQQNLPQTSTEQSLPQVSSEVTSATNSAASSSFHQPSDYGYTTEEFMSVSTKDLELDNEAMQQLCGRRDRLKMTEVSIIDVSGDAIMPDSREWLTKQLTEEQAHRPSHKKKEGPTSQQKRKHQITYLAYQAKENELELKNQWANNRMSRKQTQAKYGF